MIPRRALLAASAATILAVPRARAAAPTVRITRQPSIIYMPTYIMEAQGLIEKHAAALGTPGVAVQWTTFNGGGAATDALLAGGVDMVNTGVGNMLLLWDRTRGRVKAFVATCAEPLVLVSRDPRIKSLADFGPTDRIAVPTIKISTQAVLLSIAAAAMFGKGDAGHFDPLTVQFGHPDAMVQLLDPGSTVASHFSAPPFFAEELRRVPGCHVVTDSPTILGGPMSQALLFTTQAYAEANPLMLQATRAAVADASALIHGDTKEAVRIYRKASGDALSETVLLDVLAMPGMADFSVQPQGTMRFATHLASVGLLKTAPASWKDYFFPMAHDLAGT